ncbi:MAG: hypothetical protein AAFV53_25050, partial [Myxococcota bacterium]
CLDDDCWGTDACDTNRIQTYITSGTLTGKYERNHYTRRTDMYRVRSGTSSVWDTSWRMWGSEVAIVYAEDLEGRVRFLTEDGDVIKTCGWKADAATFSSSASWRDSEKHSMDTVKNFSYQGGHDGVVLSSGCPIDFALKRRLAPSVGAGARAEIGEMFSQYEIDASGVYFYGCNGGEWFDLSTSTSTSTAWSSKSGWTVLTSSGRREFDARTFYTERTFSGILEEGSPYEQRECDVF